MDISVFNVHLRGAAGKEIKGYVEQCIAECDVDISTSIRTIDSASSTATSVATYIFEFIQNKDVCYSFAAIVAAWIRAKHSKRITIKKDGYSIDAKNLTEKELFEIFNETKSTIEIKEE